MSFTDYKKIRPLRDDVLLRLKPTHQASGGLIVFKEQTDHTSMQYFHVVAAGPDVKHVQVGDLIVCSWKRITPPFDLDYEGIPSKFGITSEQEIDCIVE